MRRYEGTDFPWDFLVYFIKWKHRRISNTSNFGLIVLSKVGRNVWEKAGRNVRRVEMSGNQLWHPTTKRPPTSERPPYVFLLEVKDKAFFFVYKTGIHWYFWFAVKQQIIETIY